VKLLSEGISTFHVTENDVRVLAGHINALTRQQNKVVRALARHGGDLSSYINHVDDRMDNLMEGIKENKALTKIHFRWRNEQGRYFPCQ
jgi:hypothetical protein